MSVQPNECDVRMRTDDGTREEFDITIDMGGLDMENAPATTDTLRATVRAIERTTLREWSASLEQVARELDDAPAGKHLLFTRMSIVRIVARLIARKSVRITRVVHGEQLLVVFALSVQNEYLPEIKDEIALTLAPIAQTDTDLALKQMSARIAEQDKEIARIARFSLPSPQFLMMTFHGSLMICALLCRNSVFAQSYHDDKKRSSRVRRVTFFRELLFDVLMSYNTITRAFANAIDR